MGNVYRQASERLESSNMGKAASQSCPAQPDLRLKGSERRRGGQGGEEKPLLANTQRRKPCLSQPQIPSVVLSQPATSGFLILRTSEGSQMPPGVATEQGTTPPGCTCRCASSEVLLGALLDPNPQHPGAVGRRSQSSQTPGEGLQCGRLAENLSCPPPYEDGATGGTPQTRGAGGG